MKASFFIFASNLSKEQTAFSLDVFNVHVDKSRENVHFLPNP